MLLNISGFNAVALGGGPLQGFGGYSPTFAGNDFYFSRFFRSKKLIVIKINGHLGGQKMADHVLSILPSKLCAALHCLVN